MSKRKIIDMSKPIVVTMESFQSMRDAKLISDDGWIFECTLMCCDEISRNLTYYPLEDMIKSMAEPRITEKVENNVWFGEAEHPSKEDGSPVSLRRLLHIDPKNISHRIDNFFVKGNDLKGIIQWCGPMGTDYRNYMVNCNSNIAMSVRAYTPNYIEKKGPGGNYVIKKHPMHISTYDAVFVPGLRKARSMDPDVFKNVSAANRLSIRSNEGFSEYVFNDPINEFRDMVTSQEGMEALQDLYGINFSTDDIILSNGSAHIKLNSNESLQLPMDKVLLMSLY